MFRKKRCFLVLLILMVFAWSPAQAAPPTILVVGDSLSAGYGIRLSQGWVSLLQERLTTQGYPHQVINASISGDTTRGGLARLPAALERHRPEVVILELGGNDGLRALSLQAMRDNLANMIELSQQAGAEVMLVEMRIPPNYGPFYARKFQGIFGELAKRYQVSLVPFFLAGVATNAEFMQNDGIHPRANAQPIILDNVWRVLKPVLDALDKAA